METHAIQSAALAAANVRHGFFNRRGGVSEGIYASLNCGFGSGDAREAVAENRARVAAVLGVAPDRLVTLRQTHSAIARVIDAPPADVIEADAVVTRAPGLAVAVLTADCAPVLMMDAKAGVVAAAHAGWRGALGGILESAVEAMVSLGASRDRISAAVGPCISAHAYEVGDEFKASFTVKDPAYAAFFWSGPSNRAHFDLPAFVGARIAAIGNPHLDVLQECTAQNESKFFSYRRSQKRADPDYGRQISAIVLSSGG